MFLATVLTVAFGVPLPAELAADSLVFTATDHIVVVQGRDFEARADVVKFDAGKELLVLESKAGRWAVLWRTNVKGTPPAETRAAKISFWLREGRLKVVSAQAIDM
jgi:hypothetical protein